MTLIRALVVVSALVLPGCQFGAQYSYIIPDHYEGFLVIRYECPGGAPLRDAGGNVRVVFADNGTACVRDAIASGLIIASTGTTRSGQAVRFNGASYHGETGYALVDIAVHTRIYGPTADGVKYTFSILWVGDLEHLDALAQSGSYEREVWDFINVQFGLPSMP